MSDGTIIVEGAFEDNLSVRPNDSIKSSPVVQKELVPDFDAPNLPSHSEWRKPSDKQLEQVLFDNRSELKILTSRIAMHISESSRRDLFQQIDRLLDLDAWSDLESLIPPSSFKTFLRFLVFKSETQRPSLTLSAEGNVVASWFTEEARLSTEFYPKDTVRSVFSRRQGAGNLPHILSYSGHLDGLPEFLRATQIIGVSS